jgi:hypothetical protein
MDNTQNQNETEQILETIRQIQQSPELTAEAQTNPDSVLDRFQLSTIARQAVSLGIAGLLVVGAVQKPTNFWN